MIHLGGGGAVIRLGGGGAVIRLGGGGAVIHLGVVVILLRRAEDNPGPLAGDRVAGLGPTLAERRARVAPLAKRREFGRE